MLGHNLRYAGKVFYVDWPHLREALVVSIMDQDEEVRGLIFVNNNYNDSMMIFNQ